MVEDMDLEIEGVTLLTLEEVRALPVDIRKCKNHWWLRSPGYCDGHAAFIYEECGRIDAYGFYVSEKLGVRPALRVNAESTDLQIGDKITVFGYVWRVIANDLILCDDVVGESCFRDDWEAPDANDYETSSIKEWLEKWYAAEIALA